SDLRGCQPECDVRVGGLSCLGVAPLDPHRMPLLVGATALPRGFPRNISRRRAPRDATLASGRARTGSLICLTPRPRALGGPGLLRHGRAPVLEAKQCLSPAPLRPSPAPLRRAERLRSPFQESARRAFDPLAPNPIKL